MHRRMYDEAALHRHNLIRRLSIAISSQFGLEGIGVNHSRTIARRFHNMGRSQKRKVAARAKMQKMQEKLISHANSTAETQGIHQLSAESHCRPSAGLIPHHDMPPIPTPPPPMPPTPQGSSDWCATGCCRPSFAAMAQATQANKFCIDDTNDEADDGESDDEVFLQGVFNKRPESLKDIEDEKERAKIQEMQKWLRKDEEDDSQWHIMKMRGLRDRALEMNVTVEQVLFTLLNRGDKMDTDKLYGIDTVSPEVAVEPSEGSKRGQTYALIRGCGKGRQTFNQ